MRSVIAGIRRWGMRCCLRGLVAASILGSLGAAGQECALSVEVEEGSPVAYRARGNRCEGVYDQPVANRINLRIAGFHWGAPVFDPAKDEAVRVSVPPAEPGRTVQLRIVSTRRHDYYQMDTRAVGGDGTFSWPLDVVRQLDDPLQPFHAAALACVSDCDGGSAGRPTLLPVSLGSMQAAPSQEKGSQRLTVIALADVELSKAEATLRQGEEVLFENRAVGGRSLTPHRPIRIPVDEAEAGEAWLSLAARTSQGHPVYLEARLIVPEREP